MLVLAFAGACAKDDVEEARKRMAQTPGAGAPATPPVLPPSPHGGAPPGETTVATDGNALPLKQAGVGSAAELQRELPKLADAAAAASFEQAFRLTFTSNPALRDYPAARALLTEFVNTHPRFAPAYRTLAYVEFNLNPSDAQRPLEYYGKAVDLEPDYGEAHYAIAFMCAATGDRAKGVDHYRKAMALGVADERNIGERFYADLLAPN
jgi:tetratricopeptide (TPR) repeat protein